MDTQIDYAYRNLAAAVINQAVYDYRKGPKYTYYNDAYKFLFSDLMVGWCDVLGMDPQSIRKGL